YSIVLGLDHKYPDLRPYENHLFRYNPTFSNLISHYGNSVWDLQKGIQLTRCLPTFEKLSELLCYRRRAVFTNNESLKYQDDALELLSCLVYEIKCILESKGDLQTAQAFAHYACQICFNYQFLFESESEIWNQTLQDAVAFLYFAIQFSHEEIEYRKTAEILVDYITDLIPKPQSGNLKLAVHLFESVARNDPDHPLIFLVESIKEVFDQEQTVNSAESLESDVLKTCHQFIISQLEGERSFSETVELFVEYLDWLESEGHIQDQFTFLANIFQKLPDGRIEIEDGELFFATSNPGEQRIHLGGANMLNSSNLDHYEMTLRNLIEHSLDKLIEKAAKLNLPNKDLSVQNPTKNQTSKPGQPTKSARVAGILQKVDHKGVAFLYQHFPHLLHLMVAAELEVSESTLGNLLARLQPYCRFRGETFCEINWLADVSNVNASATSRSFETDREPPRYWSIFVKEALRDVEFLVKLSRLSDFSGLAEALKLLVEDLGLSIEDASSVIKRNSYLVRPIEKTEFSVRAFFRDRVRQIVNELGISDKTFGEWVFDHPFILRPSFYKDYLEIKQIFYEVGLKL
ncbi:MAG: hypothetical protein NZO16_04240, partial [Deltaproteobacteria bacterium]|nr:hypothetical protein [Deltaproteobacteria bacterium]